MKNSKLEFTLPWGRVVSTRFATMQFRGNPDLYVNALAAAHHGNMADTLMFIDRQIDPAVKDAFFTQVRNIILNRISGKTRKNRKEFVAAPAPVAQ